MNRISFAQGFVLFTVAMLALWQLLFILGSVFFIRSQIIFNIALCLIFILLAFIFKKINWKFFKIKLYQYIPVVPVLFLVSTHYRYTFDDINYWHRALVQLNHLKEPILWNDLIHTSEVPLNILSFPHQIASFEYLFAYIGSLSNWGVLNFIYNVVPIYMCIFFSSIIVLLSEKVSIKKLSHFFFITLYFAFLFTDNSNTFTYGHASILRFWLGKIIFFTAFIPLIYYIFFFNTILRNHLLFLTCLAGTSLTGSASILFPILLFFLFLFENQSTQPKLRRILSFLYCSSPAILVCISTIFYNKLNNFDSSIWINEWPSDFYNNLKLVWSNEWIILRNLLILFTLALYREYKQIAILCLSSLIVIYNPISFSILEKLISRDGYWRLLYIIPIPLFFSIISVKLLNWQKRTLLQRIMSLLVILTHILTFEKTILTEFRTRVIKKDFFDLNITSELLKYKSQIECKENLSLLAEHRIATKIPLICTNITNFASRRTDTLSIFNNSLQREEGIKRNQAQAIISCSEESPSDFFNFNILKKIDIIFISIECFNEVLSSNKNLEVLFNAEMSYDSKYIILKKFRISTSFQ